MAVRSSRGRRSHSSQMTVTRIFPLGVFLLVNQRLARRPLAPQLVGQAFGESPLAAARLLFHSPFFPRHTEFLIKRRNGRKAIRSLLELVSFHTNRRRSCDTGEFLSTTARFAARGAERRGRTATPRPWQATRPARPPATQPSADVMPLPLGRPGDAQTAPPLNRRPEMGVPGNHVRVRKPEQREVGGLERHFGRVSPQVNRPGSSPASGQGQRVVKTLACGRTKFADAVR